VVAVVEFHPFVVVTVFNSFIVVPTPVVVATDLVVVSSVITTFLFFTIIC